MSNFYGFTIRLFLVLGVVFCIHVFFQNWNGIDWFDNQIILAYLVNYALVALSFAVLLKMREKHNNSLGFVFLGGFFVKLAVFFIVFNPYYKADGEILRSEFWSFFIPYSICLSFETIQLVNILNHSE